ncbi:MAG: phage holin [Lachnospiraceae bacterium]|nr:phage holin [Lachnospiraceae bacterium]
MDNLTFEIVDVVIKAIVAFLVAYVIPVVKRYLNQFMATKWAQRAVEAAQQLQDIRKMDNAGKKSYAVEQLSALLEKYKIAITDEQIEMLIESAVKQMKIEEQK